MDTNLYSRQIGTYGLDTMKKILNLKIIIIGLRGLGIEICKNLILSGIKKIVIFDDNICKITDLSSNFYISEEDIDKKRRDESCLTQLTNLNPNVEVEIIKNKSNIESEILNNDLLVITQFLDDNILYNYNDICRKNNKGLIYTNVMGLSGFLFNDFGEEHIIFNKEGKNKLTYYIKDIYIDDYGYILQIDTKNNENLFESSSDYFSIKEVNGIEELNQKEFVKIKIISNDKLLIEDIIPDNNSKYISGGIIKEFIIPETMKFKPLKESIQEFFEGTLINISKKNKELFHIIIIGVQKFISNKKYLPEINNENHILELIKIIEEIYDKGKKEKEWINSIKNFNKEYISKVIRWLQCQISPICSFLGGIVSQEVIKYTGKYIPIKQWLFFDFFESIENIPKNCDRTLKNSRYDEQIAIFGNEIISKLGNMNLFMIGAGALGCEFLKNFSLMGIGRNNNKSITITDNDNIEISNLSRQFLFRNEDIHKNKAEIACKEIKKINNKINLNNYNQKVCKETENIFSDEFYEKQDIIISAVDNFEARRYLDNQSTFYNIPFLECGTIGTSGTSSIIIPKQTTCFNDISDEDNIEIPICTIKSFPSQIEHCIAWSQDYFKEFFEQNIIDLNELIDNQDIFFKKIDKEIELKIIKEKLLDLKSLIEVYIYKDYNKLLKYALNKFNQLFYENILDLLNKFPYDYKDENGFSFWGGSRRMPNFIKFDLNDHLCLLFILSFIQIYQKILFDKKNEINLEELKKNIIKIKSEDEDNMINTLSERNEIEKIKNELKSLISETKIKTFNSEIFDKDKEDKSQSNFLYSCTNLRARNYKIEEEEIEKIILIAGKIIPAIISTTATISGLVSLQIYIIPQTNNIYYFRSIGFEMKTNIYSISSPEEVNYMKNKDATCDSLPIICIPNKFSVWDNIEIKGTKTVKEIIAFFKINYDVDLLNINSGIFVLYDSEFEEDLNKTIEELYLENYKIYKNQKYIRLKIVGRYKECSVNMPIIKYIIDNQK